MQNINLKPELVAMARTEVLYKTIHELVRSFCVDDPTTVLEKIKKGIYDNHYFRAINIYFLNSSGLKVAEAVIEINWDMHIVKISGQEFHMIDKSKSIHEQISVIFPTLIKHVEKMKRVLGVTKTAVWFSWRNEVSSDTTKLFNARKELGFSTNGSGSAPEWTPAESIPNISSIDDITLEFISDALEELKVTLKHKKTR